ncbi:MAG: hypothetical protein V4643_09340, partial [Bacteroidota bacterium]
MIKKIAFAFILLVFITANSFANDSTKIVLKTQAPEAYHGMLFQLVGQVISNGHYRKVKIDDSLSKELLTNYCKHLDPLHLYFLQSDIDGFKPFENQLDDDLLKGDAQAGFDIYNKYQTRLEERINYTFDILNTELDFTSKDSFQ